MKCQLWGDVEESSGQRGPCQAQSINVTLTEDEVERGMGGVSVGAIDVDRADGLTSRFWVRVYRSSSTGRIKAEIRANHHESETHKDVTGTWMDYEKRREEALNR